MPHVFCLDCDRKIMLHTDISVGDQVACSSCDSEFQIIGLSPIEIEWLYDDYDDDDYEDDDEDNDELDDEDEEDEEDEEEWAHMVAKQRRHVNYASDSVRKNTSSAFQE